MIKISRSHSQAALSRTAPARYQIKPRDPKPPQQSTSHSIHSKPLLSKPSHGIMHRVIDSRVTKAGVTRLSRMIDAKVLTSLKPIVSMTQLGVKRCGTIVKGVKCEGFGGADGKEVRVRYAGLDYSGKNIVVVKNVPIVDTITGRAVMRPQSSLLRLRKERNVRAQSNYQKYNIVTWAANELKPKQFVAKPTFDGPTEMEVANVVRRCRFDIITGRLLN